MAQAKLIAANAFELSDDPTQTNGPPTPLKVVPFFNLRAAGKCGRAAEGKCGGLMTRRSAAKSPTLSGEAKARLVAPAADHEQAMTSEPGLPGGRGWYKNRVVSMRRGGSPGYGAKTLPGVREAIEDERGEDAAHVCRPDWQKR